MSLKSLMISKKDSVESLYMKFSQLLSSRKDDLKNNIFCFYEGKDAQYYLPRIRMLDNNQSGINDFTCKGKENVLKINRIIKDKCDIDGCKLLFFVDKDFDDNSNLEDDIYVTPYYAIENFCVRDNVIKDFLSAELQLNSSTNDANKKNYEGALKYFYDEREKFINDTLLLNAWYSLQIKKGNLLGSCPDMKEIKVRSELPSNITIEILKEKTIGYIEVKKREIDSEVSRINDNPLDYMRGKYFVEFLCDYFSYITSEKAKRDGLLTKKQKVSYTICKSNIISLLSKYAVTPQCLKRYIQSRINVLESSVAS